MISIEAAIRMASIETSLEALIQAVDDWSNEPIIAAALEDACNALGYDPRAKQERSVSLTIDIWSTTPKDAVEKFMDLIKDSQEWSYEVIDEKGKTTVVDTMDWKWA